MTCPDRLTRQSANSVVVWTSTPPRTSEIVDANAECVFPCSTLEFLWKRMVGIVDLPQIPAVEIRTCSATRRSTSWNAEVGLPG